MNEMIRKAIWWASLVGAVLAVLIGATIVISFFTGHYLDLALGGIAGMIFMRKRESNEASHGTALPRRPWTPTFDAKEMMRHSAILLSVILLMGCSHLVPADSKSTRNQSASEAIPAAAKEATALLLESTGSSREVEDALDEISGYADSKTRFEKMTKAADGSLHIGMLTRYPMLGIAVRHYDQKFAGAFRIEKETSNKTTGGDVP
jgi:hypothetical protein